MLLKLYNLGLIGCLFILSHFFSMANGCEEKADQAGAGTSTSSYMLACEEKTAGTSSYMLATGIAGQERLDRIEEVYGCFSQLLLKSLSLSENAEILSVGCGTGTRECQMAQRWPHAHIIAIDNAEDQLKLAREKASRLGLINIDFVVGDANNLLYENQYELVYVRFMLMHVQDPRSVLKGMERAAKPGGLVVCEELSSSSFFCQPDNQFYQEAFQLTQLLAGKIRVDYDIGVKLFDLMTEQGLTFVEQERHQPDRSDMNVKKQLLWSLMEAKPKLLKVNFDEQYLDNLLQGLEEFADQEFSRISMSDLFQVVGHKPSFL